MADKTIPQLDPVVTPAATDRFGVRQAGDTEDKRETREQVHALEDGEYLVNSFTNNITANPASTQVGATGLTSEINIITTCEDSGDSVRLPATFPVGAVVEVHMRGTTDSCDVFPAVGDDLGEGLNTALLIQPNQQVRFIATVADSTWIRLFQELIQSEAINGALIEADQGGGFNSPSVIVDKRDTNTGIGGSGDDQLFLVAGGANAVGFEQVSGGIFATPDLDDSNIAFAGGGQGSAFPIRSSYSVIDTVASPGDSVILPSVFLAGRLARITNIAANAMDIFPAVGDDLGEGVDTAFSLLPGESVFFLASVQNSTWLRFTATHPNLLLTESPGALAASPTLRFGDGDTGWFESSDDVLDMSRGGTALWRFIGDQFIGLQQTAPGLIADRNSGEPSLLPRHDDTDTGWGWGAANEMRAFAGLTTPQMIVGEFGQMFVNTVTGVGPIGAISSATPGLVSIFGAGFTGEGQAGNVEIWGGYASGTTSSAIGGDLVLWGGSGGGGAAVGGDAFLIGGFGDSVPGDAIVRGGVADVSGVGGAAIIVGGAAVGAAFAGGIATVDGGAGLLTGAGGAVSITGGIAGATDASVGGAVNIAGGTSAATNGDGGDVNLLVGAATGSGVDGTINFTGDVGTDVSFSNAAGPAILDEAPTFANPVFVPNKTDDNTGVGWNAPDGVSLVAGGVFGVTYQEFSSSVIVSNDSDPNLTADVGSAQGNGLIISSYNHYSTVANPGDAATLPAAHAQGTSIYVKNDGANAMDVFPNTGDDLGEGTNVAVSIPPGGSVLFFTATANTTWTQLFVSTGAFVATSLLATTADGPAIVDEAASSTNPTLIPERTDFDTGVGHLIADALSLIAGGRNIVSYIETADEVLTRYGAENDVTAGTTQTQAGATLINSSYSVVTTVTVAGDGVRLPGAGANAGDIIVIMNNGANSLAVYPAVSDSLGEAGVDQPEDLPVGSSVTYLSMDNATWSRIGAGRSLLLSQINSPTNPTLAFGDADTGIYEGADDQMRFAAGGSAIAEVNTTGVVSSFGTAWKLIHEGPTATNPTIAPAQGDLDTGIGGIVGADTLSLISGGVAGLQLPELNSNVIQAPDAQIGLTAFATGGQGSATQVNAAYAQFSTVATLADSGRLPPVFKVGSIITVKNDGAADMDMFPSSGDDLGAGTDTAVSIVAGTAAKFMATVADATWTQIGSSVAV